MKACMNGKSEVVELLLRNSKNIQEMTSIEDSHNMNGFKLACRWGKYDVVDLLLNNEETKMSLDDIYFGYKLACTKEGYKVIRHILKIEKYRAHILEKENQRVTKDEFGQTILKIPSKWMEDDFEIVITLDENTNPVSIGVKCKPIVPAKPNEILETIDEEQDETDNLIPQLRNNTITSIKTPFGIKLKKIKINRTSSKEITTFSRPSIQNERIGKEKIISHMPNRH